MTAPRRGGGGGPRCAQAPLVLAAAAAVGLLLAAPAQGYDALDPLGNVTLVWDIISFAPGTYTVNVSLVNHQTLRSLPSWNLSWTWQHGEYIASAEGAEATFQGSCKHLQLATGQSPHSCLRRPTMVDLPLNPLSPIAHCCKGGFIASALPNQSLAISSFQMVVGNGKMLRDSTFPVPKDFSLGVPGYTCSAPFEVPATNYTLPYSQRVLRSVQTHNAVCTFRQAPAVPPTCCVSLSAFYSPDIAPCAQCACACASFDPSSVLCSPSKDSVTGVPTMLMSDGGDGLSLASKRDAQVCSPDGCPLNIRFHIKKNYQGYWLAKVTVFNRRLWSNYTAWNLAIQHPNAANVTLVQSFRANSTLPFGSNDTLMLYGVEGVNDWLMSATAETGVGLVQSEILFGKGPDFTFDGGWAFPRRVLFNGEECVMPSKLPQLPNSGLRRISDIPTAIVTTIAMVSIMLVI